MDTFTIILDNLTRHGVPDALERANEIEAEMQVHQKPKTIQADAERLLISISRAFGSEYVPRKNGQSVATWYKIGEALRIDLKAIQGRSRVKELTEVRHLLGYLLYKKGYSLPSIGLLLNRDHSSILSGRDNVIDRLEVDKQFKRQFDKILL